MLSYYNKLEFLVLFVFAFIFVIFLLPAKILAYTSPADCTVNVRCDSSQCSATNDRYCTGFFPDETACNYHESCSVSSGNPSCDCPRDGSSGGYVGNYYYTRDFNCLRQNCTGVLGPNGSSPVVTCHYCQTPLCTPGDQESCIAPTGCTSTRTCTASYEWGACSTSCPTPTVSLRVNNTISVIVNNNTNTTLSWSTTNTNPTRRCTGSDSLTGFNPYPDDLPHNIVQTNTNTTNITRTYTLTCYNYSGNASQPSSVSVTVRPPPTSTPTPTPPPPTPGGRQTVYQCGSSGTIQYRTCTGSSCPSWSTSANVTCACGCTNGDSVHVGNVWIGYASASCNQCGIGPPLPSSTPAPTPPTSLVCFRGDNNCPATPTTTGYWRANDTGCQCNCTPPYTQANVTDQRHLGGTCWVATSEGGGSTSAANAAGFQGQILVRRSNGQVAPAPTSGEDSIYPFWFWIFHSNTNGHCILQGNISGTALCYQPGLVDARGSGSRYYAAYGDVPASQPLGPFLNDTFQVYSWSDYFQPIGYYSYQQVLETQGYDEYTCSDTRCCSGSRCDDALRCVPCRTNAGTIQCRAVDCQFYEHVSERQSCRTTRPSPQSSPQPLSGSVFTRGQLNTVTSYCMPDNATDARVDLVVRQILFRVSGTVYYQAPGATPGSAPTPYGSRADTSLINLSGPNSYNVRSGTDSNGTYSFTRVPEGNNALTFSAPIGSNLRVSGVRINNGPQTTIPAETVFLNNLDQDTRVDFYLTYNPPAWIQTVGGDVHSDTGISLPNAPAFNQGAPTCSLSSLANASLATATDLVSTPVMSRTLVVNPLACVISPRAAFAPYMIPTFDDLLSLYYTQAKPEALTANLITKHDPLTRIADDYTQTDIPLTSGSDHLYYIKKTYPASLDGNLNITGNILGNQTGVVFVDGDLNIGPIPGSRLTYGNSDSGLVFVVRGNVNIDPTITQVDAILISAGTIYTAGAGCSSSHVLTPQLTINGSLISLDPEKSIKFCRTLTDNTQPSEIINYQVKYLVILRNLMSDTFHRWNEIP